MIDSVRTLIQLALDGVLLLASHKGIGYYYDYMNEHLGF